MSREAWERLVDRIRRDESLRRELEAVDSVEAVVAIAAKEGYDISPDDFARASGELSNAELEGVTGSGAIGCSLVFTFFCPTVGNPSGGCP